MIYIISSVYYTNFYLCSSFVWVRRTNRYSYGELSYSIVVLTSEVENSIQRHWHVIFKKRELKHTATYKILTSQKSRFHEAIK